ncbi:MAG: SRPBCC family protein [Bacteroidota bacterium]|nr:SRPBCC family protein [Bacteroidota bacterium]
MTRTFVAKVTIEINADSATVWKWLTTPELIKQYFFGTQTETDWKKGSPIFFRGEWEGKKYEDKGTILDIQSEKFVKYNYWSSMSGTPDIPENYATIVYELTAKGNTTILSIMQDGIKTEESKTHSEQNWNAVMGGMKKMVEQ